MMMPKDDQGMTPEQELPGMWSNSDFTGGKDDLTPEQEAWKKMRAAFNTHCDNLRKQGKCFPNATNADLWKELGDDWTASWQACAAQSAEIIARLEEEKRNLILAVGEHVTYRAEQKENLAGLENEIEHLKQINHFKQGGWDQATALAAAAQADNARLRDEIETIAIKASGGLCQFGLEGKHAFLRDIKNIADKLVAQPLDVSVLEAYVESKLAEAFGESDKQGE